MLDAVQIGSGGDGVVLMLDATQMGSASRGGARLMLDAIGTGSTGGGVLLMLDANDTGSTNEIWAGACAVATRAAHARHIVKLRNSESGFIREATFPISRLLHPKCLSSSRR